MTTENTIGAVEAAREAEEKRFEEDAQRVACPVCAAPVGAPCRTTSGRKRDRHMKRTFASMVLCTEPRS